MWVLSIELRSSGKANSDLNHCVFSPALRKIFSNSLYISLHFYFDLSIQMGVTTFLINDGYEGNIISFVNQIDGNVKIQLMFMARGVFVPLEMNVICSHFSQDISSSLELSVNNLFFLLL